MASLTKPSGFRNLCPYLAEQVAGAEGTSPFPEKCRLHILPDKDTQQAPLTECPAWFCSYWVCHFNSRPFPCRKKFLQCPFSGCSFTLHTWELTSSLTCFGLAQMSCCTCFLAVSDVYVLFVLLEQWFWILQDSFGNLRKAMALPNPYPKCTRVQRLSYNCADLWTPDVLDDSWLLC